MLIYGYKLGTLERSTKSLSDAPGNASLLAHLKAAGNVQVKDEWINGRLMKLYRPQDFEYALSWTKTTRRLLNCERQTVADVLLFVKSNRDVWLSFE